MNEQNSHENSEPDEAGNHLPRELPKVLQLQWRGQDLASLNRAMDRGKVLEDKAKYEDAERLFRDGYNGYSYLLGPKESTLDAVRCVSRVCRKQGKYEDVAEIFVDMAHQMIRRYGQSDYRTLRCMEEYSKRLLTQCCHMTEKYGQSDRRTLKCMEGYARLLLAQGCYLDGELILDRVLDGYGYDDSHPLLTEEKIEMWMRPVLLMADACLSRHEYRNVSRAEQLLTKMEVDLETLALPKSEDVENRLAEIYLSQEDLSERAESVLVRRLESNENSNMEFARKIYFRLSQYYQQSSHTEKLSLLNEKYQTFINTDARVSSTETRGDTITIRDFLESGWR